jgi:hypothetical protein
VASVDCPAGRHNRFVAADVCDVIAKTLRKQITVDAQLIMKTDRVLQSDHPIRHQVASHSAQRAAEVTVELG